MSRRTTTLALATLAVLLVAQSAHAGSARPDIYWKKPGGNFQHEDAYTTSPNAFVSFFQIAPGGRRAFIVCSQNDAAFDVTQNIQAEGDQGPFSASWHARPSGRLIRDGAMEAGRTRFELAPGEDKCFTLKIEVSQHANHGAHQRWSPESKAGGYPEIDVSTIALTVN